MGTCRISYREKREGDEKNRVKLNTFVSILRPYSRPQKQYLLLLVRLLCAGCIDNNNAVAGNNPCSFVWTVCGGSGAMGPSYGPIGIVLLLGFCGGSEEGNQNMECVEAIWRVENSQFAALMDTVGSGGRIQRSNCHYIARMGVVGEGVQGFWSGARGGEISCYDS
jgi:hypothetical protein